MKELAQLRLPGNYTINAPGGIPSSGLATGENILTALVNLIFILAFVLGIIFLVLGGIRWITSAGDPKGIEAARKQITYAIIGMIIVVLAYFIINTVGNFLGVRLFAS